MWLSGDAVLIADSGNNRILRARVSGPAEALFDRAGREPGRFLQPASFCRGDSGAAFWIVDRVNHRVQEVSVTGTPLRQIGRPGLGKGCLDMPEQAAILEDGSLVVSQSSTLQALTVFSRDGQEIDHLKLPYAPKGLLAHEGFLLVCEWWGNYIHVHEFV